MPVIVNGAELQDADIERELPLYEGTRNPAREATVAAILRRLVREEAARLGLAAPDGHADPDEALTTALLDHEATVPTPDEASCRRHYEGHPEHFHVGAWVEAEHILFQVTPYARLDALRALAEQTLDEVRARPSRFAELARTRSNCPSGGGGGRLGRLFRGETTPEFERALFEMRGTGVLPAIVESRHGLHVVKVLDRHAGERMPFETVHADIARALAAAARDRAWKQYATVLIGKSRIEGIELDGADSPLVQ